MSRLCRVPGERAADAAIAQLAVTASVPLFPQITPKLLDDSELLGSRRRTQPPRLTTPEDDYVALSNLFLPEPKIAQDIKCQ